MTFTRRMRIVTMSIFEIKELQEAIKSLERRVELLERCDRVDQAPGFDQERPGMKGEKCNG